MDERLLSVLRFNRVKEERVRQNITQWQLGLLSHIAQARISQIENGAPAKPDEQKRLAMALNVNFADLFGLDGCD